MEGQAMLVRKLLLLAFIGVLGVGLSPGTGSTRADDDDDDDWGYDWDEGPRLRVWRGDWYAPPPAYYSPAPLYRYGYYAPAPYRVYAPPAVYVEPRVYRWAGPVIWESWD
jgi:hypothetical protein